MAAFEVSTEATTLLGWAFVLMLLVYATVQDVGRISTGA